MLNYLRAEIYKFLHRKSFWITLVVVLGLEGLMIFSYAFTNAHGNDIEFAWGVSTILLIMGSLGCYFTLLTGDMVFAGQYKHATLKNEVSFGLPRYRIYLGKLVAQLFASLLMCGIMVLFYVIGCKLFLLPSSEEGSIAIFTSLGQTLLGSLPIWMGVQATVCACFFLIRSEIAAASVALGLFAVSAPVLEIIGLFTENYPISKTIWIVYSHLPTVMLDSNLLPYLAHQEYWPYLGKLCIVGGAWFVVSTAMGLWFFERKEIN